MRYDVLLAVWINMIFISTFLDPALRIAAHLAKQRSEDSDEEQDLDLQEKTLEYSHAGLQTLATILSCMVTIMVCGALVPALLLMAVLWGCLNLCSLVWIANSDTYASFGELLARRILVHAPLSSFRLMVHLGNLALSAFIIVDLEFSTGAAAFYFALHALEICMPWIWSVVRSRGWCFKPELDDGQDEATEVRFRTVEFAKRTATSISTVEFGTSGTSDVASSNFKVLFSHPKPKSSSR